MSTETVVNIILGVVSIVLAIFSIWLSLKLYKLSEESSRRVDENTKELAVQTKQLSGLYEKMDKTLLASFMKAFDNLLGNLIKSTERTSNVSNNINNPKSDVVFLLLKGGKTKEEIMQEKKLSEDYTTAILNELISEGVVCEKEGVFNITTKNNQNIESSGE